MNGDTDGSDVSIAPKRENRPDRSGGAPPRRTGRRPRACWGRHHTVAGEGSDRSGPAIVGGGAMGGTGVGLVVVGAGAAVTTTTMVVGVDAGEGVTGATPARGREPVHASTGGAGRSGSGRGAPGTSCRTEAPRPRWGVRPSDSGVGEELPPEPGAALGPASASRRSGSARSGSRRPRAGGEDRRAAGMSRVARGATCYPDQERGSRMRRRACQAVDRRRGAAVKVGAPGSRSGHMP